MNACPYCNNTDLLRHGSAGMKRYSCECGFSSPWVRENEQVKPTLDPAMEAVWEIVQLALNSNDRTAAWLFLCQRFQTVESLRKAVILQIGSRQAGD